MKKILMLPVFVTFLLMLSFSVSATEYDNPVLWYYHSTFGDVVQSIHDCSDDGSHCLAVVWNDYYNRLEAFYTPDPEDFTSWCPQYPSACSRIPTQTISVDFPFARWRANWSNWHMGFGVVYSPANNRYYVWKNGQVYYMPINGSEENLIQDYTSGGAYNYRTFIGQGEDDNGEPFLWALDAVVPSLLIYYPSTNSFGTTNYLTGYSWSGVCLENCVAGVPNNINWIRWYYARNPTNESGYLVYNYSRSGAAPFWTLQTLQKNVPTGFNSTAYWIDGTIYGNRESYPNETDGIYISTTSDFLTYTTPVLYYAYNATVNEDINASWGLRTDFFNYYQFDRERNTSGTDWGIGYNRDTLSNLVVSARFLDDCIGINCQNFPAPVNIRVECRDINYTSSTVFNNIGNFFIPCSTNVTIVLDTLDYNPVHSETTLDLPCSGTQNIVTFELRKIYDLPFFAYDAISFDPIYQLTFTLNGVQKVTNANGRALFRVDPITNVTLSDITNPALDGACGTRYQTSGDFRDYSLTTSHSEYQTKTESFTLFDYPDQKNVFVNPRGINVYVRIKRADGIEVFPDDTGVTRVQGSNITYWYTYQKFQSEFADKYPARFLLVDNRSTFLINITFTFAGTVYDTFQYQGQNYTSFNVSQDQTYTFWFVLPTVQPCERSEDCVSSYCDGNTFFSLIGCIANTCEYAPTVCEFFCDSTVGCYKVKTVTPCNTTFDCDSVCTGNYTAEIGFCGADGFCVKDKRVCTQPCEESTIETVGGNRTIGMCPEILGCYILGAGSFQTFQLDVKYLTDEERRLIDTTFRCALATAGIRECISGVAVTTLDIDVVASVPKNWIFDIVGLETIYQDISVLCSEGCNITYEYCQYGCNPSTKTCYQEPSSPAGAVNNAIAFITGLWGSMFPTIFDTTIAWFILAIIIAGLLEYAVGGRFGRGTGVIFGITALGMIMGGWFVGQLPFEIMIVLVLISGFIVWRMWMPGGNAGA